MNALPIDTLLPQLRTALASSRQIILEAPTGAGKSTALPSAMLDWPELVGRILLLEPRRVAARSIAGYLAKQRQQSLGQDVGVRMRGETVVGPETRLEIITEGILTRMIQQDPLLDGVAVIIFDEIHERHLSTDLGLALALEVQSSLREDLRIITMSATLQGLALSALMPAAQLLRSEGRSYPVTLAYRAPPLHAREPVAMAPWLLHMGRTLLQLLQGELEGPDLAQQQGSILAFLPGRAEIYKLQQYLSTRVPADVQLHLMYGDLPVSQQEQAIAPAPAGKRKLVLATNVAESSLTIDGITMVVDSGYRRQASFNPRTGVTRLGLKRISQASAQQRAGRAGRLCAGFCLRLWSQEEQGRLAAADDAEIATGELLNMVLEAANWGVRELQQLPLLSTPNPGNETVAWELLQALELVNDQRKLTAHGQAAYQFGASPRLAHMLVKAQQLAQTERNPALPALAALLCALLESRISSGESVDVLTLLPSWCRGTGQSLARMWLQRIGISTSPAAYLSQLNRRDVARLLALAFPDRIARARGKEGWQLANGTGVVLDSADPLASEEWLVVAEFQEQEGRSSGRVFLAAALPETLLRQELAFLSQWQVTAGWDDSRERFTAERQLRLGKLILKREPSSHIDADLRRQALLALIRERGLAVLDMNDNVRQLQYRLALAQSVAPQRFPDSSDGALLATLESWLGDALAPVQQLKQLAALDINALLLARLAWPERQSLEEWLPTHWTMATATRAPIRYEADGRALLSVRLQEAFGMAASPVLLQGRLTVTMELLSPAQRPLAVTADLDSFWRGPYGEVKKEMRGRYPKHLWPDDPANTLPTKYTKKRTTGHPC